MGARVDPAIERIFKKFLRPYQRDFLEDSNPRQLILKSRRIGMSEAVLLKGLLIAMSTPYHDVYLCSTSYTNAKELLRRLYRWLDAFAAAGAPVGVAARKKTELELTNGSRIIPFPAMSVRGRTGTVILDEFAFYQHDRSVWAGIGPVADTDPSFRIIIVSTPFGASGMFHDLWADPEGVHGDWSRRHIDVYQAAAQGFPVDPEALRKKYPSDIWRQEFCCEFLSDINQYFSHDLIRRSQYDPDDLKKLLSGGTYLRGLGVDLASARDGSIAAQAFGDRAARDFLGAGYHTLKPVGEARDYADQFDDVAGIVDADDFARIGVDGVGEGKQLGQDLRRRYGSSVVEVVTDAKKVSARIPEVLLGMERGNFRFAADARMARAFSKISKKMGTAGHVRFEARRDSDGHADEFSALLHAYHVLIPPEDDKKPRGFTPTPRIR